MNTNTNTTQRRGIAAALLATAITATAVGLAATGHADTTGSTQLQALIPTPANTQRTDGPAAIANNGIRMHFLISGSATAVLDAYKTALEGKGWTITVARSGGYGGAGGATYTGTRGDTYGVFTGGGYGGTTDVSACAWQSKPSNTNCGSDN